MDATTQFEDIHHSKKADEHMLNLYIGDFYNPDAEKESWEDYVRRKQREEANQMSFTQKAILIGVFLVGFSLLYNYIVGADNGDVKSSSL